MTEAESERRKKLAALDEYDIRRWFMAAELEQAADTFRVVEGIIETRQAMQPKRARRKDAGVKRAAERTRMLDEEPIDLKDLGPPDNNDGGSFRG